jgi:hypothetical protein
MSWNSGGRKKLARELNLEYFERIFVVSQNVLRGKNDKYQAKENSGGDSEQGVGNHRELQPAGD